MRYLDPKNDLPFKRIFGEHPDLLKSFLNAILPLPEGGKIESLEYLPAELVPDLPTVRKNSITDVRCRAKDGRQFLVEMQVLWTESFQQRVLFNASKAYVRQLRPGEEYKCLQPVISLNLLNDKYLGDEEGWYHHYKIVEVERTGHVIQGLEFLFVELPKFRADAAEEVGEEGRLWLRFLTEVGEGLHGKAVPEELLRDGGVRQAVEMVEMGAYSEGELATYDAYWDAVSLERTVIGDSIREGIAQGKQIGMVEGEQIGERKTKIALAKKMVEAGMDVLQIEELTGLKARDWDGGGKS